MSKYTPWFPGHIKPVRAGVYQQKSHSGLVGYQRWDGKKWFFWYAQIEHASTSTFAVDDSFQNDAWRGLASPAGGQS